MSCEKPDCPCCVYAERLQAVAQAVAVAWSDTLGLSASAPALGRACRELADVLAKGASHLESLLRAAWQDIHYGNTSCALAALNEAIHIASATERDLLDDVFIETGGGWVKLQKISPERWAEIERRARGSAVPSLSASNGEADSLDDALRRLFVEGETQVTLSQECRDKLAVEMHEALAPEFERIRRERREARANLEAMTAARDYEKAAHQRTRDYYEKQRSAP